MDCLEFRRQCATEPSHKGEALAAHLSGCKSCAAFAGEMAAMDKLMVRALQMPVPESLQKHYVDVPLASVQQEAAPTVHKRVGRPVGGRWLAIAASFIAAAVVSIAVWRAATPDSLGGELVAHVRHEPMSLLPVVEPVAMENIDFVLRRTGARAEAPLGTVTYIRSCPFRNEQVAHIVIEGSTGPVTLLLLPHISVEAPVSFEEDGMKGTIVPVGKGSVAIIGNETEPLEAIEKKVSRAVAWQI